MGTLEARAVLREALRGPGCTSVVPAVDVLTARLAQQAGWNICKLNSSGMKATNYGLLDEVANLVTSNDYADVIRRIRRAAPDIAIMVDADDCGGTPEMVFRWVEDMEAAGISGIEIEDRGYLPYAELGKNRVASVHSIEQQVENLKAALEARNDPTTSIIARTCAFSPVSVDGAPMSTDEARERIRAYAAVGVDAFMIPGQMARLREDIELIREETDLPLCVLRMPPDVISDAAFLERNNVRIRYISQSTVFGRIVPFAFDILKELLNDVDGTTAVTEEDRQFGATGKRVVAGTTTPQVEAFRLLSNPPFLAEFLN